MIHFIHGTLADLTTDYAVIDCGGMGFKIGVSLSTVSALSVKKGKDVLLYTHLAVSEDNMSLYGFSTEAYIGFGHRPQGGNIYFKHTLSRRFARCGCRRRC